MYMVLPWLEHVKAPNDDPGRIQCVRLFIAVLNLVLFSDDKLKYLKLEGTKAGKLLNEFLFDLLLLPYGSHPSIKPADPNEKAVVPPALSEAAWKRVAGDSIQKAEDLEKIKANVVRFLGRGLIPDMAIAMHLVVAMADTRHSVSTEADSVMRRVSGGIDWNDKVNFHGGFFSSFDLIVTLTATGFGQPAVRRFSGHSCDQRERWQAGHNISNRSGAYQG